MTQKCTKPAQDARYKKVASAHKLMMKRQNVEYVLLYANVTPFLWDKGKFRCFYCMEHMKDPDHLREHTTFSHQHDNLELAIFDRTKSSRNKDAAVKIDVTGLSCKLCTETVSNLDQLIHHLIIAHDAEYDMSVPNCLLPFRLDKDKPTCAVCDMSFAFFEYLLRHANKNHLSHGYMCDVCGTSFQGENHLHMHNRYYHREGGYDCEKCGVALSTLSQKLLHEKNVHMERLESCPKCPETFKSPYFKRLHLAKVHGVEDCKIKCPYCQKAFPHMSIMSRHMRRVHLKEKNVQCKHCSEKFFNSYDLKMHSSRHSGEKKFVCNECGKKFSKKANLNGHIIALHCLFRKYSCKYCDKSFAYQSNLSTHLKNQHSNLLCICAYCNVHFYSEEDLKSHIDTQHDADTVNNQYIKGIGGIEEEDTEILQMEFVGDEFYIEHSDIAAAYVDNEHNMSGDQ